MVSASPPHEVTQALASWDTLGTALLGPGQVGWGGAHPESLKPGVTSKQNASEICVANFQRSKKGHARLSRDWTSAGLSRLLRPSMFVPGWASVPHGPWPSAP